MRPSFRARRTSSSWRGLRKNRNRPPPTRAQIWCSPPSAERRSCSSSARATPWKGSAISRSATSIRARRRTGARWAGRKAAPSSPSNGRKVREASPVCSASWATCPSSPRSRCPTRASWAATASCSRSLYGGRGYSPRSATRTATTRRRCTPTRIQSCSPSTAIPPPKKISAAATIPSSTTFTP